MFSPDDGWSEATSEGLKTASTLVCPQTNKKDAFNSGRRY